MKTAYELAMERLNKTSPVGKVTDRQKKEMAELESKYKAKIAERELFVKGEMAKAVHQGDVEALGNDSSENGRHSEPGSVIRHERRRR